MGKEYLIFLIGATLLTYLPRVIPLLILSRVNIPDIIIRWLRYIPIAILAALLAPGLLVVDGKIDLTTANINLIAAIPTFLVAIYKKNIFLTIIVGIFSVIILQYI